MATLNPSNTHSSFSVICVDGDGVPISFPLGNDRHAFVTSLRLNLRLQFSEEFMYIDEEVYDALSRDLIQTIRQSLISDGDTKQWLFNVGRYQVYGMSVSMMATSTKLVTPHQSSLSTVQLILASWVKVEKDEELITILSDDSDGNLPVVALLNRSPLVNSALQNLVERTPIPISHPLPHVSHQQPLSVVDSLKRLRASKGARNALES
jgi:hypothetical protein